MVVLYALVGLPFAGKSGLARELRERTGATLVRLDAINHERGLGLDGAAIPAHEWETTYQEAYRRIGEHLAAGRSVAFDHGNFTRAERDKVRTIGATVGADVHFVYVQVSAAEARRRLLRNRQIRGRVDVRDEDFNLVLRIFEPPDAETDVLSVDELWAALNALI